MGDAVMPEAPKLLLEGLHFVIIPNAIPDAQIQELTQDVEAGGGTLHPFDAAKGRIDTLEQVTHIISTTSDFPDYHRALDLFINVVKPGYVSACLQLNKLKNPRAYSPDPVLFLNEVVVTCGHLPSGDVEAIEGGVIAMGGQFSAVLSKQVTHVIALDIDDPRCKLALDKRLRCFIVLPHWFDDCVKLGRKISERPYLLPDPEILDINAGAIPTTRASPQIRDATSAEPPRDSVPPSPRRARSTRVIQAFDGKSVKLSADLPVSQRLKDVIAGMIQHSGGKITDDIDEAHIYVCNYREGPDYVKASQANKDVGNLSWLYFLMTHDVWTNPMRRMMHYPRPPRGLPGFDKYKISISSYTGEARVYLENLVKASGAEFTKTFKQDNTHLITAHKQSEKCEAAEEWGVHVVNHLWLEESYANCKEQTLTNQRYNCFPARTNLGEILGQTELDRNAVENAYFPTNLESKSKSRISKAATSKTSDARTTSDQPQHSSPLTETASRRTKSDLATPARKRDDKENQTPGTTGSRGAKDRALSKLHDSAPDIAQFEKEMKRKGGVVHGGRRHKDAESAEHGKKSKSTDSTATKRSIEDVEPEAEFSDEDVGKKAKKAKKSSSTPILYRAMLTGDTRWQGKDDQQSKDKGKLRELGIFITEDPKSINLLCAPKIVRTQKFVSALACAPVVVASSFLDDALKHNKLPDPRKHHLLDVSFEQLHGFSISDALKRAEQNQRRLLRNWTIFCTDRPNSSFFATFKGIIEANGGRCLAWKGRSTALAPAKRTIDPGETAAESQNQEEDEGDVLYLISEEEEQHFPVWAKFRQLAEKHDMVPRIVKTEWILFVAMAQYVHWNPKWELTEEMVKTKNKV